MNRENQSISTVVTGVLFGLTALYPVAGIVLSVTKIIPPTGVLEADDGERGLLGIVFVLVGLSMGIVSFVVPLVMARIAASQSNRANPIQTRIVGMALAEGSGVMGLVLLVLLGDLMLPFVLWAVALVACIPHLRDSPNVR